MSFLNPIFLIALTAVGIPLLIHLLNLRRPQKIQFSTLAFFSELQKTTIKRIKIKRYVLLLLRIAAIICLAFVLSRPFLPPSLTSGLSDSDEPAIVAFLIDNSVSMERIDKNGPIFDQAKEIVSKLVDRSKEGDQFILQLTNGTGIRLSEGGQNELRRKLEAAEIEVAGNFTNERIENLLAYLSNSPYRNKKLFVLSDGQASQLNFENDTSEIENNDVSVSYFAVGNPDVQNTSFNSIKANSDIISVGLPVELEVSLKNYSQRRALNQFVSLEFEGNLVGQYAVELGPEEEELFTFQIIPNKTGYISGKLIIEGDEFTSDNEYYFSVFVPEDRSILWITDSIEKTGSTQSYSELILEAINQSDTQLSYSKNDIGVFNSGFTDQYDTIILDGLVSVPEFAFPSLVNLVQNGKGLIFFPSPNGDLNNYNKLLSQFNVGSFNGLRGDFASFEATSQINELPQGHPILDEVFDLTENENLTFNPPNIYYNLQLQPSESATGISLLKSNVDDIILRQHSYGNGRLFVFTLGNEPGWSDLPVNPVFAPLYYRTLLYASASESGGLRIFELGQEFNNYVETSDREIQLQLNGEIAKPELINSENGFYIKYPALEWKPGWLQVTATDLDQQIGINLPEEESDFYLIGNNSSQIDYLEDQLKASIIETADFSDEELESELAAASFGKEIWYWFMWAGFLLLVMETLVSIYYKA